MGESKLTSEIEAFREAALQCPLPPAVELIGEKWTFLILRGAFNGLQHFEEFQAGLGIARNILSDRLAKLVAGGILERSPDPCDGRKVVYALAEKGKALLPVVIALRQWGEQWGSGPAAVALADRRDGLPIRRICVQAEDGRPLELDDLMWIERDASLPCLPARGLGWVRAPARFAKPDHKKHRCGIEPQRCLATPHPPLEREGGYYS